MFLFILFYSRPTGIKRSQYDDETSNELLESQLQEFYHRYDPERVLHVRHDLEQYSLPELCQMILLTYREVPLGWRSIFTDGWDGVQRWTR